MKVVCINDKVKPAGIPDISWIKKGEVYTVIESARMAVQRSTIGYRLSEVSLPPDSEYQYYTSSRFRPYVNDDSLAKAAVEELMEIIEPV